MADAPIDDASVPVVEDVRPSVLYIEDNPMNAEVVVEFLSSAPGLRVDVVETIAEGRAVLAERTPSLLLLDLNLPDGFGGDLAEDLAREGSPVPVVLVTADAFAAVGASAPTNAHHSSASRNSRSQVRLPIFVPSWLVNVPRCISK